MFGKFYSILFIVFIACAFIYQKYYINKYSHEIENQSLLFQSQRPIFEFRNFKFFIFEELNLETKLTANSFTYHQGDQFFLNGSIIYTSYNRENPFSLKTERVFGHMISEGTGNYILDSEKKLHRLHLPDAVHFQYSNGLGKGKNMVVDALKNTVESDESIVIADKSFGTLEAVGFYYSNTDQSFNLRENVKGSIFPESIRAE